MKNDEKGSGTKLAKVLWYYNLIPDTNSSHHKIVCPFHDDLDPSLSIDYEKGSWFCFGCSASGDASTFVKLFEYKYNQLNDLQAFKKYIEILKSDKCSNVKINRKLILKNKKSDKELYDIAYDYYHGLKTTDWLHPEHEDAERMRDYMLRRGFKPKTLNMCKAKYNYNDSYELIFPLTDNGKFKGWVCRTSLKHVEDSGRKYLYNKGFSRATTLVVNYGSKDSVIVVE